MDKLIIGIAILWGGLWLLGVVLRIVGDFLNTMRQQWNHTRPGLERVGHAIGHPLGLLSATVSDHRLMSVGLAVVFSIGALFLAGADSAGLISSVDGIGGRDIPLLGWALLGGVAGLTMGIGSRALELGWFGRSSISRVPDIGHLREGEAAAVRHFRVRLAAAIVGAVILAVSLTISHSRNAGYDAKADYEKKAAAISSAGTEGKITILNAALDDATGRLQSDPKSGLKVLLVLTALSGDAARPEVERVAKISRKYLEVFRDKTEKLVTEGKPEALARSEAFLDADRVAAVKWLGRLYEAGSGGANKDLPKAFAFYGEAASKGDKTAASMLDRVAHMMASAKDEASRFEAFKYLQLRAQSGGPNDHYWMGQWYAASEKAGDQRNAEMWLAKVLDQDADRTAKNLSFSALAKLKDVGLAATKILDEQAPKFAKGKDEGMKKVAYSYLEQRANADDPGAMLWMGFRFAEGDGIAKDAKNARDWFLKAALQNQNIRVKDLAFVALGERVFSKKKENESTIEPTVESPPPDAASKGNVQDNRAQPLKPALQETPIRKPDSASKTIAIPANSRPSYNQQGWECNGPAYKQVLNECRLTVKPENSNYSYNQQGWECKGPAYKQVDNECRLTVKPENSNYSYNQQGWECKGPAYKQVVNECRLTVKPENSNYSYNQQGWECKGPAYKQVVNECRLTVKPENSNYSYNQQGWECKSPVYKQVGNECWKLQESR
jgi:TPR repeat protein